MLSEETLTFGRAAARAILGLDQLYRSESGDSEGLVVVNLDSERTIAAEAFPGYADGRKCFEDLRRRAGTLPEADRRVYYDRLCLSALAFITWRQGTLPFAEQLAQFLHVPAEPAPESELTALRTEMQELLGSMGFDGELSDRCHAWEERVRVPRGEVPGLVDALMNEAWDRTERLLLPIPASREDGMRLLPVSGVGFNARCNYLDRRVELNMDPVLTRPGLKHLVAHECYPGHYMQFKMREHLVKEGKAAADGLFSVVNTASSSVFEGIGDAGVMMLEWSEGPDDLLQNLMNRYRAGIGTGAAWRLHALCWDEGRVRDWLRSRTLVGGEGWVANRMRFIAAPSRAVLIWSYWWGERLVPPAWLGVPKERRGEFLEFLFGRMHSNESVGMFA